jgi:hypothetical protein
MQSQHNSTEEEKPDPEEQQTMSETETARPSGKINPIFLNKRTSHHFRSSGSNCIRHECNITSRFEGWFELILMLFQS